jgi:hypothetical protein
MALGLCTGLLPAAALTGSKNISDLISISVETIAICFRLALELYRRTRRIEDVPGHWAYTVLGVSAQELDTILEDFHRSKVRRFQSTLANSDTDVSVRTLQAIAGSSLELKKRAGLPSSARPLS